MKWEIARVEFSGTPGTRMLDRYLAEGWQPFAAVRNAQGQEYVYLRRQSPSETEGARDKGLTTEATSCVMDLPEAWKFVRGTEPEAHHPRCSWRTQNGAFLCDCDVLWDEYVKRGGHRYAWPPYEC